MIRVYEKRYSADLGGPVLASPSHIIALEVMITDAHIPDED